MRAFGLGLGSGLRSWVRNEKDRKVIMNDDFVSAILTVALLSERSGISRIEDILLDSLRVQVTLSTIGSPYVPLLPALQNSYRHIIQKNQDILVHLSNIKRRTCSTEGRLQVFPYLGLMFPRDNDCLLQTQNYATSTNIAFMNP